MKILSQSFVLLLLILATVISGAVYADRGDHDRSERRDKPQKQLDFRVDKRYEHDRRYPREGYTVKVLPERRHPIHYHDRNYFYVGGVWYLSSGPNYVVVRPPVGVIVPILPPFYTTVWLQGTAYYYANDIYYVWRPDLNGYQVANPPITEDQPEPAYLADELFIYPKQGQSEKQQADDRYACHRWGVEQSKYDPIQPPAGLPVAELSRMREDYQRAMKACLEGKGYSVR